MATPNPSSSRIVVQQHEDGRLAVLVDGKPLPGLVSSQICHEHGQRAVLNIEIAGIGFRLDTSPLTSAEATVARREAALYRDSVKHSGASICDKNVTLEDV